MTNRIPCLKVKPSYSDNYTQEDKLKLRVMFEQADNVARNSTSNSFNIVHNAVGEQQKIT